MQNTSMGNTSITVNWKHIFNNGADMRAVVDKLDKEVKKTITDGTGAGKAQAVYADTRSLLTTASEDIDLRALVSTFGLLTATKIKAILINPVTAATGYRLLVGGAATNAFSACFGDASDVIRVDSGSLMLLTSLIDGWTVDTTHKLLKIENPSGGTFEYEILILVEGSVA